MLFKAFMPFVSSVFNQLLPPTCLFCTKLTYSSRSVCEGCYHDLPILSHHCEQCAQVIAKSFFFEKQRHCGKCLTSPPPFTKTHALFIYQAPITRLIATLKFEQRLAPAAFLGISLAEKMKNDWYQNQALPELLLPVPLHIERLGMRGFNQALEIARPLSKALSIPLDLTGVRRIKATEAQSGLSAAQRRQNLKGAFLTTKSYTDQYIAIIDDVLTTSSTVTALALTLKAAGAKRIDVIAAARAIVV